MFLNWSASCVALFFLTIEGQEPPSGFQWAAYVGKMMRGGAADYAISIRQFNREWRPEAGTPTTSSTDVSFPPIDSRP